MTVLLERDHELAAVSEGLALARAGAGRCLVVEGPAGIGKSALLLAARAQARDSAFDVSSGAGGELETDFPYGVVRQLFEPAWQRARSGGSAHGRRSHGTPRARGPGRSDAGDGRQSRPRGAARPLLADREPHRSGAAGGRCGRRPLVRRCLAALPALPAAPRRGVAGPAPARGPAGRAASRAAPRQSAHCWWRFQAAATPRAQPRGRCDSASARSGGRARSRLHGERAHRDWWEPVSPMGAYGGPRGPPARPELGGRRARVDHRRARCAAGGAQAARRTW